MTNNYEIRWFKLESFDGVVFGIYKAKFKGKTYLEEKYWYLNALTPTWESATGVRDWYFIGKDNIWEISEADARAYLPASAFET